MNLIKIKQVAPSHLFFNYEVNGDRLTAIYKNTRKRKIITDVFDFSNVPNGQLDTSSIETKLPLIPIISVSKENNQIIAEVLEWTHEENDNGEI